MEKERSDIKMKDIDAGKVDFFYDHDEKLNAELDRFYALTIASTENREREALLQEREAFINQSQEYKNAAYDLKDLLSRSVGFQEVTERDGTSLQEAMPYG